MRLRDWLWGRKSKPNVDAAVRISEVTFDVSSVPLATTALPEVAYKDAVEDWLLNSSRMSTFRPPPRDKEQHERIEACSSYRGRLVAGIGFHPVVAAVHRAFHDHRRLVLSPDVVWLLIAQGFSHHVNANAEELRPKLVRHSDKLTIEVRRDDFVKGSPENPWPEIFGAFSNSIREHIGAATHDLLLPDFSTTGTVERAAAQVVLLDALQSYFCLELCTLCGIPRITLEGTPEDWEQLAARANNLGQFGLEWWTRALAPILDEFVAAARGRANAQFWKSIYKLDSGSGGPYATGWITAFFPYLTDWQTGRAAHKSPWLTDGGQKLKDLLYPSPAESPHRFGHGPSINAFPSGLARAPFLWKHFRRSYEMEFLGGFVGVRQGADTLCLRPEIGWAVRQASPKLG